MATDKNKNLIKTESSLRVTNKEVDETIEQLQIAFGDGRLDENDFEDRMNRAFQAKTKGDIAILTKDLEKKNHVEIIPAYGRRVIARKAWAVFSGIEQKGHFILPSYYQIKAIMGGCLLDLSHAQFEKPVSEIHITAIMGGVQIIVPDGVRIVLSGLPIMGGISQKVEDVNLPVDAPVLHIHCLVIMAGVEIKRQA